MVSTYKNPTRIVRKVEEVSTAWERIAPKAEFGGMTLPTSKLLWATPSPPVAALRSWRLN